VPQEPRRWAFDLKGDFDLAWNRVAAELPQDLLDLIENKSGRARLLAVEDLGRLLRGERGRSLARAAREALEQLEKDPDRMVARSAAAALLEADRSPEQGKPSVLREESGAAREVEEEPEDRAVYQAQGNRGGLDVPSLFPLYGITLGLTTEADIATVARHGETIDKVTGAPYRYYVLNDVDFWYDEHSRVIDHMYMTHTDSMPTPWTAIGLEWAKSYNEWLVLLQDHLGYSIRVVEHPHITRYDGHDSFTATVVASREAEPCPHQIELEFQYSSETSRDGKDTLYSLRVSCE
jgi:hypothetical protein